MDRLKQKQNLPTKNDMAVDYSVYLVTDNTPAILRGRDLVAIVKAAVEGGGFDFDCGETGIVNGTLG